MLASMECRSRVMRAASLAAMFALFAAAPAQAEGNGYEPTGGAIGVALDQAKLIRVPDRVTTIVIGNPLIADISVQPGGLVVITGKGYGMTNIIALDRGGVPLLERKIQVKGPPDAVVVYKGVERETFTCAPKCEPRVTIGDTAPFFQRNLTQTTTWSNQVNGVSQLAR
jgi:Flp pilus assembly secretin CpaC